MNRRPDGPRGLETLARVHSAAQYPAIEDAARRDTRRDVRIRRSGCGWRLVRASEPDDLGPPPLKKVKRDLGAVFAYIRTLKPIHNPNS